MQERATDARKHRKALLETEVSVVQMSTPSLGPAVDWTRPRKQGLEELSGEPPPLRCEHKNSAHNSNCSRKRAEGPRTGAGRNGATGARGEHQKNGGGVNVEVTMARVFPEVMTATKLSGWLA